MDDMKIKNIEMHPMHGDQFKWRGDDEQTLCPQLRVTVHLVLLNKHDSKLFNYGWGCNSCKGFIFLQILIYCLRKTELRFKSYDLNDFQHFQKLIKP